MLKKFTFNGITILLLIIASNNYSKASILYTDVIDTTISRSASSPGTITNSIDINNDGIFDYNLVVRAQVVTPTGCTMIPSTQTNLFAWIGTTATYSNSSGDSAGSVASVNIHSVIGPSSSIVWNNSNQDYLYNLNYTYPSCIWDSTIQGNWGNGDSNYIALKLKVGSQIYYGWLHVFIKYGPDSMNVPSVSVTILDYAFEDWANIPIYAGETSAATNEENLGSDNYKIRIYPNPAGNEFYFQNSTSEKLLLEIFDFTGRKVHSETLSGMKNKIDFSAYTPGVYTYSIKTGRVQVKSGKLVKQ